MPLRDFKLKKLLGKGGYGSVYEAIRRSDGKTYAIKVVNTSDMSPVEKQRTVNEIRLLASVKHPNVCGYYEAFVEKKKLFIVMEYAEKGDLHQRIKRRKVARPIRRFREDLIWAAVIQIALGLKALHQRNIVHRDIKSSNVFINSDNSVTIGDLGVAKVIEKDFTKTMVGTPYYQSPEIWAATPYDTRIDVWSLGCVAYEMAALTYPFNARDYKSLGKKVLSGFRAGHTLPKIYSPDLVDLIHRMLVLDPNRRITIEELLALPAVRQRLHLVSGAKLLLNNEQQQRDSVDLHGTIRIPRSGVLTPNIDFPSNPYPSTRVGSPGLAPSDFGGSEAPAAEQDWPGMARDGTILPRIDSHRGAAPGRHQPRRPQHDPPGAGRSPSSRQPQESPSPSKSAAADMGVIGHAPPLAEHQTRTKSKDSSKLPSIPASHRRRARVARSMPNKPPRVPPVHAKYPTDPDDVKLPAIRPTPQSKIANLRQAPNVALGQLRSRRRRGVM